MIKFFKNLLKKMIEIGNTIINTIFVGDIIPSQIDVGDDKVWPDGENVYIILPSTGTNVLSTANYAYVSNISASTKSWTVESDNTSWLTVTKTSNKQARFDYTDNGITERTAHLDFKIDGVTYATFTVRQTAAQPYIVMSPTFVNLTDGLATAGTISVSSNTQDWVVSTTSAGFTAEKYAVSSTYIVRWTVNENTTGAQRVGYINASYDNVTATTQINQSADVYVFTGLTTNPMSIGSAQTSFSISLVSRFGQAITEQPSVSIGYNAAINVQLTSSASGGTTGQWNYVFSCNANDTESQRTTTIVFTQPGSNKTLTYVVQQAKKFVTQGIAGITSAATYGNWILGTVEYSTVTAPGGDFTINGAVIVSPNPITKDYTATISSMAYQTGPTTTGGSPTVYNVSNLTYNIPSGSTFTASGTTYNGIELNGLTANHSPRMHINQANGFIVS